MTNGEKLQEILNIDRDCVEVHGENGTMTFTVKQDWWNAEYKEPTTKNNLGVDCISRADVERAIEDVLQSDDCDYDLREFLADLKDIPSVTPIRPKGHWIKGYTLPDGKYWKCDKCKELIKVKYPMCYCNNCGSDNREVEE